MVITSKRYIVSGQNNIYIIAGWFLVYFGFSGIETQSALFVHLRSKADQFKAKWCWCIPIYNNELSCHFVCYVVVTHLRHREMYWWIHGKREKTTSYAIIGQLQQSIQKKSHFVCVYVFYSNLSDNYSIYIDGVCFIICTEVSVQLWRYSADDIFDGNFLTYKSILHKSLN